MSAKLFGSFVFTPVCFIMGSCFIYAISDYIRIVFVTNGTMVTLVEHRRSLHGPPPFF